MWVFAVARSDNSSALAIILAITVLTNNFIFSQLIETIYFVFQVALYIFTSLLDVYYKFNIELLLLNFCIVIMWKKNTNSYEILISKCRNKSFLTWNFVILNILFAKNSESFLLTSVLYTILITLSDLSDLSKDVNRSRWIRKIKLVISCSKKTLMIWLMKLGQLLDYL